MEVTKYPLNDEWRKQDMVFLYNGIPVTLKKEGNSDIRMNAEDIMLSGEKTKNDV